MSSLLTVKGRFGWGRRMLRYKKSTRMRLRWRNYCFLLSVLLAEEQTMGPVHLCRPAKCRPTKEAQSSIFVSQQYAGETNGVTKKECLR